MTIWLVRWQGEDPADYGCDWPYRRVEDAPATPEELADGITEPRPTYEAEVIAPTADAARCAIIGCYCGQPPEVWGIEATAAGAERR